MSVRKLVLVVGVAACFGAAAMAFAAEEWKAPAYAVNKPNPQKGDAASIEAGKKSWQTNYSTNP